MPLWTKVLSPMTLTTRRACVRRQHVAQAQPHADAGAHAHQRVHRLERRQHAQRVAADVAGDDAVQLAQRVEDRAVRAALAQAAAACRAPGAARATRRRPGCGARARRSARRSGYISGLHSTAMPAARSGSARYGSPSSMTTQRSTLCGETRGWSRAAADRSGPASARWPRARPRGRAWRRCRR